MVRKVSKDLVILAPMVFSPSLTQTLGSKNLLVWLFWTFWVTDWGHYVVLLVQDVVSDTSQVSVLTVSVQVDLDNTVVNTSVEFLDSRTGTTVEDQEQWLFFLATNLFSGVLLVFSQDFWSQSDVTSVQTVTVTESSSNGEVWRDWVQSLVYVVNLFWLVYKSSLSAFSLLTPSSSPPVIPISISNHWSIAAILKYLTQVEMFSSSVSSDKSNMWEENNGSPCSLSFTSFQHTIEPWQTTSWHSGQSVRQLGYRKLEQWI